MDEPTESEIITAGKLGMTPEEVKHIIEVHFESVLEVLHRMREEREDLTSPREPC